MKCRLRGATEGSPAPSWAAHTPTGRITEGSWSGSAFIPLKCHEAVKNIYIKTRISSKEKFKRTEERGGMTCVCRKEEVTQTGRPGHQSARQLPRQMSCESLTESSQNCLFST